MTSTSSAGPTGGSLTGIPPLQLTTWGILRGSSTAWHPRPGALLGLASWYLGRSWPAQVTLRRRPSGDAVRLSDRDEARFLLASLYLVAQLGAGGPEDPVTRLRTIEQSVRSRLFSGYPGNGRPRPAGYPGPKAKDALLYLLVRRIRPSYVLETGVDQGVSSTFVLEALRENGHGTLVSVDIGGPTEAGRPVGWVVPPELRDRWDLRLGPAEQVLPTIDRKLDLFLHDSLHTYDHMMFEFAWAEPHLPPGSLLMSDDIGCNASYLDFLERSAGRWRSLSNSTIGLAERLVT